MLPASRKFDFKVINATQEKKYGFVVMLKEPEYCCTSYCTLTSSLETEQEVDKEIDRLIAELESVRSTIKKKLTA